MAEVFDPAQFLACAPMPGFRKSEILRSSDTLHSLLSILSMAPIQQSGYNDSRVSS